jgi:hypothetical protein
MEGNPLRVKTNEIGNGITAANLDSNRMRRFLPGSNSAESRSALTTSTGEREAKKDECDPRFKSAGKVAREMARSRADGMTLTKALITLGGDALSL